MLTLKEAAEADCDAGASTFLQSGFWGAFKSCFGWKPLHFRIEPAGDTLLVLQRRLARGLSFAYIPRGPVAAGFAENRSELLAELAESLRFCLDRRCVFIRFDPLWITDSDSAGNPVRPSLDRPFRRASADIQPPNTTVLHLSGHSDDQLLSRMKPKWRYNIRLSEKRGVKVCRETGQEALDAFYSLYETTAARDRIALHPKSYYGRLLDLSREYGPGAPDIRIWIARYEGKALAGIITSFFKSEAVYLYGASGNEHRDLMPAYALQWAALRAAREAGCEFYDFYGIPPRDNPGHPMSGLYRFKTGFGGDIRHYPGSWDYPLKPVLYRGFRAAEALRTFWFKKARKRLLGIQG